MNENISTLFLNDKNCTMNCSFNTGSTAFLNNSTISKIKCNNEISRIRNLYVAYINGSTHL